MSEKFVQERKCARKIVLMEDESELGKCGDDFYNIDSLQCERPHYGKCDIRHFNILL